MQNPNPISQQTQVQLVAAAGTQRIEFLGPAQLPDEMGRLGPYRVQKILGQGGMGMVFLADDPRLRRTVALKVMLPEIAAKPSAKERFFREARATAQIEHDHIIPIYEVSEDNGVPYIAMPFLKGMSLEDYLKNKGELSVPQILKIGREIAKGLSAAHTKGLIHRDIKPANLWLDAGARGRVKILDFGLARLTRDDEHLTATGAVLGTPAFMSPEQAAGLPVDAKSDLFSLGAVLYRLCTGRRPFLGKDVFAVLTALAIETPPPVRELNPSMPEELSNLISCLLEKDPARRPASAKEVAEILYSIERSRLLDKLNRETGGLQTFNSSHVITLTPGDTSDSQLHFDDTDTIPASKSLASRSRRAIGIVMAGLGVLTLLALGWTLFPRNSSNQAGGTGGTANSGEPAKPEAPAVEVPLSFEEGKLSDWVIGQHFAGAGKELIGRLPVGSNADIEQKAAYTKKLYRDFELKFEVQLTNSPQAQFSVVFRAQKGPSSKSISEFVGGNWTRTTRGERLSCTLSRDGGFSLPDGTRVERYPFIRREASNPKDYVKVRLRCQGSRVTLHYDNKPAHVHYELSGLPAAGFIGFCVEGRTEEVRFRDIRIQELSPSQEPKFLNFQDLSDWEIGRSIQIKNEEIIGNTPKGSEIGGIRTKLLLSKKVYRDFELSYQVRHKGSRGFSGVQFRSNDNGRALIAGRWMWKPNHDLLWCSASEDLKATAKEPQNRTGVRRDQWNDVVLRCVGKRVTVRVNGDVWQDNVELPDLADQGQIGFHISGALEEIAFRNVRFTNLNDNALPLDANLTGWTKSSNIWTVQNDTLVAAWPKTGPVTSSKLISPRMYRDYEMSFDFRSLGELPNIPNKGYGFAAVFLRAASMELALGMPRCELGPSTFGRITVNQVEIGKVQNPVPSYQAGEYMPIRIRCLGRRVIVEMAGRVTTDVELDLPAEGSVIFKLGISSKGGIFRRLRLVEGSLSDVK